MKPPQLKPAQIRDRLADGSRRLGVTPADAALDRLTAYFQELEKWNRKMNLVGVAPPEEIIDRHFLDSLALGPILSALPTAGPLLDIGSGAGFPGLVLKAAFSERQVVLVEPRQKRATFLRHVIRTLQLADVEVQPLHLTADDHTQQRQLGRFPLLVSRALTDLGGLLSLATAFCAPTGFLLCMKGRKAADELSQWQQVQAASPFAPFARHTYTLPFSGIRRHVLVFQRI